MKNLLTLGLGFVVLLATLSWSEAQGLRCVPQAAVEILPAHRAFIQPAAGAILARLQLRLTPVRELYVVEGDKQAAIFYFDGRMLCGPVVVDAGDVAAAMLSVVFRFGA